LSTFFEKNHLTFLKISDLISAYDLLVFPLIFLIAPDKCTAKKTGCGKIFMPEYKPGIYPGACFSTLIE
jgi:hypothetical protein